ncbi:MAG: membrane protein insertion efficiency factor YidD [Candidatus Margulisiibacteriota bacterium]
MGLFSRVVIYLLTIYQKVKPRIFGMSCRYYPTCSSYAIEAIQKHGLIIGLYLALKRLIRCNQYFPGGFDPVP